MTSLRRPTRYASAILAALALSPFALAGETALTTWQYTEQAHVKPTPVTIPHTWNASDMQVGKGTDDMGRDGYRRGLSKYTIVLPATTPGKRVFVRFEGVSAAATVDLDGHLVGEHLGCGTAFEFELTAGLKSPGPHTLGVVADNTWRPDLAPLSGDFGVPGGIYRPVTLIEKDTVCFVSSLGDTGLKTTQANVSKEAATLSVVAHVDNAGEETDATVVFTLKDAAGKVAATQSVKQRLRAGRSLIGGTQERLVYSGRTEIAATLDVASPRLWNGLKDPHLYSLEVSLESSDGSRDVAKLPFGFRTVAIDKDKGFLLNGESYPLRGVNRHQDREGQSWAITREQEIEDAEMIAEIGANAVRAAHYPHSRVFLDACDRLGLLVWSEAPLIDTVGWKPDAVMKTTAAQLREMIAQQRNHPSVFGWSLFNEIGQREKGGVGFLRVVRHLNDVAHEADPTRPTLAATNWTANKELNTIADAMAYNKYPAWYGKGDGSQTEILNEYRTLCPDKPWGISEYGAGASLSQQDDTATHVAPGGKWHPESWQCRIHEKALESIQKESPALWGTFVWNMYDFASPWRHEGERDGINDKGLVTYDRKTRKDAFYLYRANWSKSPVLRLLARRDDKRKSADTVIRYYSNLDDVKVTFNGAATAPAEKYGPNAYIIKGVKLNPGANQVTATAKAKDGSTVTDSLVWTLSADAK